MKDLKKKALCIFVAVSSFCSGIAASAKDEVNIYSYESFEEYVTNDVQNYFNVDGISDVIVSEISDNNKALMINKKALYSSELTKTFSSISGDVIFQFDIKIEGERFQWNVSLKSSNGKTITPVKDTGTGELLTNEGKKYGAIGKNRWVNIAILYSPYSKRYSIFVDHTQKLSDWILTDKSFDMPNSVEFQMNSIEQGDSKVYIDNFKIYSGEKLLKENYFKKQEYNKRATKYVEKEISESNSISYVDNFDYFGGTIYDKGNIVEIREENGNKFLHFEETKSNDCFIDYSSAGAEFYTVCSVDVRSSKYTGFIYLFSFKLKPDNIGNNTVYITSGGEMYLYNGVKIGKMKKDKWQNVSIALNYISRTFDVYLDGDKISENVPMQAKTGTIPSQLRFYCAGGQDNVLDIDNVAVYYGKEPRNLFDESTMSGYSLETTLSFWDTDSVAKVALDGKTAYNAIVSSVYQDNNKYTEENNGAFVENKIIYLPVIKTAERLGKSVSVNKEQIRYENVVLERDSDFIRSGGKTFKISAPVIEKNDVIYAPIDAFGEDKLLGEKLFYSDRGLVVFGIDEIGNKEQNITQFTQYERPVAEEIIEDYKDSGMQNVHPRILLKQEDFELLKHNIQTDDKAKEFYKKICKEYQNVENIPVMEYRLENGERLLPISEEIYRRVISMSLIYKISGDTAYADRVYKELEAASKFPGWHPTHFLDVARMVQAFSIGYDWLYDYLTEEQRDVIETAMVKFGMREYLRRYTTKEWWSYDSSNWAAVCNGGAIMMGMALIDKYPQESGVLMEIAIKGLENCLYGFGPDGAWYEGPGYWNGTIEGLELALQTLKSVLNKDYNLSSSPGFSSTTDWAASVAYNDKAFGYADAASTLKFEISYRDGMWMGNYFRNPLCQMRRMDAINKGFTNNLPLYTVYDLMWYVPEFISEGDISPKELDFSYREVEMGSTRSSWRDDAMFLAYKGGSAVLEGHNHMDSGTFSLFQDGICWANDYGYDNYNSRGYYEFSDNVKPNRWSFYRTNTQGHNCIVINPDEDVNPQDWKAMSKLIRFESKEKGSIGVVDLSDAYAHKADKYIRGYMLADDGRSATIRDEISIPGSSNEIYWFMHTGISGDNNFEINGNSVIITHESGEKLYLEFTTNAHKSAIFTMDSEFLPSFKSQATDMWPVEGKKIVIKLEGGGDINLTVKMYDNDLVGKLPTVADTPISEWTIPEGICKKAPTLAGIYKDSVKLEDFNENKTEYTLYAYFEEEFPKITAVTNDNAHIEVKCDDEGSSYRFKVISDDDAGFFSNYVVKIQKIPHTYEELTGYTRIKPKTITGSRVPQSENPPQNVNDGDFATRYAVDGDNEWVLLDYGEVVEADAFAVSYYMGTQRISYYDILISEDGINYNTIFEGATSGVTDYYELYKTGRMKLRYFKLVGHKNSSGDWNSPTEIALLTEEAM